ncbi:MAG: alpha/beta hydrolase [Sinobacteraceae bacterium]|nr:alpha/beta hydrolase [Nevskiaceae bacterium]
MGAPERRLIAGPAGQLELLVDPPREAGAPRALAVCCHPHPLFGGSLTNKVVHTLARACCAAGAVAVRFNFRGVGASEGAHDEGRGELDDLRRVLQWARTEWPELPLWLGGFSFGAWIALQAHAQLSPDRLITIAPPVGRWDFSAVRSPACPWLCIQGDRDELVDAVAVATWVKALNPSVQLVRLAEADHFFHARLHELSDVLAEFLAPQGCSE